MPGNVLGIEEKVMTSLFAGRNSNEHRSRDVLLAFHISEVTVPSSG